jgi:hypothetical protein
VPAGAPSRGVLPVGYLSSHLPPQEHLSQLDADAYAGFNLFAADLRSGQMAYLCNRGGNSNGNRAGCGSAAQALPPGLYGVSNAPMTTSSSRWPKVEEGRRRLQALLGDGDGRLAGGGVPWDQVRAQPQRRSNARPCRSAGPAQPCPAARELWCVACYAALQWSAPR